MAVSIAMLRKALRAKAPVTELKRIAYPEPMPWPSPPSAPQLPLWETVQDHDTPWPKTPRHLLRYACIGCGRAVRVKRTYCRRCEKRLEANLPVDLDEYLTDREYRELSKRMPGNFVVGQERKG